MSATESGTDPLAPLRQQIDAVDQQMVELLNERARLSIEVGKIKAGGDRPTFAPEREQQVFARIRELNAGPLSNGALEAVYREIISGSVSLQRPIRIGYLGPDGSFSHLAASRRFGSSAVYTHLDQIPDVFQAVERDTIDLGLVPIENSTGGGIHETLDCFMQSTARVCAEVLIHVHHNVMSLSEVDQVQRLFSRPEVFEQCRRFLGDHFRSAERLPVNSSAKAAERAAEDTQAAAIGSSLAAEIYKLPIRHANIEDNPNNITRFFVIGRQRPKPSGDDKTAIMFTTAHKPGALADVLDVFRRHKVNLTHIDKRPSQRINWEYYFFVDCEGHQDNPNVIAAMDEARTHCLHLTVLGSCPRATEPLE
jgi:chorismate mutase/prephenate dehydratase